MTVCTKLTVPVERFALHRALSTGPDLRIEFERLVPLGEQLPSHLWVSGEETDGLADRIVTDEDVDRVSIVGQSSDDQLLHVEWGGVHAEFLELLVESSATVLDGIGTNDGWTLSLRFPSRDDLSSFYRTCCRRDFDVVVHSIQEACRIGEDAGTQGPLTEPQRDALSAALERGYFDVPRKTTLRELSEHLGISDTATSQRLRRGLETIVSQALT